MRLTGSFSEWPLRVTALVWSLAATLSWGVTFDWAFVGNAGNNPDDRIMSKGGAADMTTGYGAVDYDFRIAKQHVTNTQYTEFLNSVDPAGDRPFELYNSNMSNSVIGTDGRSYTGGIDFDSAAPAGTKYATKSGQENYPATWINWTSGARFVNWLSNGQGTGDTENGVYDMSLNVPERSPDASFFLPSEDEFYKAAYYDPNKDGSGGYWEYGIQADTPPTSEAPAGGTTSANRSDDSGNARTYWQRNGGTFDDSVDYLTEVGAYEDATSHYGLHDVDGLMYQWTEASRMVNTFRGPEELPIYRGGAWYYGADSSGASHRNAYSFREVVSYHWYGLRIAALPDESGPPNGDFDDNGTFEVADIDALVSVIAAGTNEVAFDMNGDGIVDTQDRDAWLVAGGAAELASGNGFIIGDADLSGQVNSTDLGLLLNNFGESDEVTYSSGDLNGDSVVNSTDLGLLLNNFGAAAASASAVPEPNTSISLILGTVLLAAVRRRRN